MIRIISNKEFIGRMTTDNKTRVIVIGAYLLFYQIKSQRIEIASFWDNRQDDE
jgi:hypothetical protein